MGEAHERGFYARNVVDVARDLLGAELVRETADGLTSGIIVETEAYSEDEPACHAFRGPTTRTKALFGEAGRAYVYLSYGCHWLFNVVSGQTGIGCGVLIRALEPTRGVELMKARRPSARSVEDLASGPGKLTQALAIASDVYGAPLWEGALTIRKGDAAARPTTVTTRVGISQARDLPLRFYVTDSHCVSRRARKRSMR